MWSVRAAVSLESSVRTRSLNVEIVGVFATGRSGAGGAVFGITGTETVGGTLGRFRSNTCCV